MKLFRLWSGTVYMAIKKGKYIARQQKHGTHSLTTTYKIKCGITKSTQLSLPDKKRKFQKLQDRQGNKYAAAVFLEPVEKRPN